MPDITWRRTFPECEPGTDGVAEYRGRAIGRVRVLSELPGEPKLWFWTVTDPDLVGKKGWGVENGEVKTREEAMAKVIERWRELREMNG